MRFLKIGLDSTQKCKTHKTNVFYTILGGSWRQKVVSVFFMFLEPFRSRFYCYMGEKLKVPNDIQRSAQIKKLKKTNQL